MATTANMGLTTWSNLSDVFSHTALENNFTAIDEHDHTSTKGVKVGVGGIANLAVGSAQLQDSGVITSKINNAAVTPAKLSSGTTSLINPAGISPYFRAYRSSATPYSSGATILFDSEADPNGWYDPATGLFLPTVAGTYRIVVELKISTVLTADKFLSFNLLSDVGTTRVGGPVAFQRGASGLSVGCAVLLSFNGTTNALSVIVSHDNGGTVTLATLASGQACWFEAQYVGA